MSTVTVALMLVCAGNPSPASKAEIGTVGVIRLPVNEMMLEKLKGDPPVSRLLFVGEPEPQREWIIGGSQDAATGYTTLLRLTKSGDPLSPFSFKSGRAIQQGTGQVAFEALVEGKCYIRSANTRPEGEEK